MRIRLKDDSVKLDGLSLEILYALYQAALIWRARGMTSLVITSAIDGPHKPSSLHHEGHAIDLRSRTLPDDIGMAAELASRLGDDYDVVVEQDHLHIEYDPRA
jgi:hypothetical protein